MSPFLASVCDQILESGSDSNKHSQWLHSLLSNLLLLIWHYCVCRCRIHISPHWASWPYTEPLPNTKWWMTKSIGPFLPPTNLPATNLSASLVPRPFGVAWEWC